MGRVSGKVALVTGAASGIGRGVAQALASEGAHVIVTDIDETGLKETGELIRAAGGTTRGFRQDVTSEQQWIEIIDTIRKENGALHVLVNNAGIGILIPLVQMSFDDWKRQNAINLDGVFLGLKYGIPLMADSGGGSIINMSSVAGLGASPGLAGYGAGKAAVRFLSKSAAIECAMAKNNIRVNSVHPGMIETPIWVKLVDQGMPVEGAVKGANSVNLDAHSKASVPVGYQGLPKDIAMGVVYLASDESRYVTGTELVIDGGIKA